MPDAVADRPRVLLFGPAGSGKSTLLAALARCPDADLLAVPPELLRLREAVYDDRPLDDPADPPAVTDYHLTVRPAADDGLRPPVELTLTDCDGDAANALLANPDAVADPTAATDIRRAVVGADAIALLVNAATPDDELNERFEEFDTFLTSVGQAKAAARDVGGLPVYLVLTQCDRLAQPGDTRARWAARVDTQKREALAAFNKFLHGPADADPDAPPSPFLPFGSLDVRVAAVAAHTPALAGERPPRGTPWQVAELFRDSISMADDHRRRATASDRRLTWTVRGVGAGLAALLVGFVWVTVAPPGGPSDALADRIRQYELVEQPPAVRLAGKVVAANKAVLARFRRDAGFFALPPELQSFVTSRADEIDAYQAYRVKLAELPAPAEVRSLDDLARVEAALNDDLALPGKYSWAETEAGQLRDKFRADIAAIRETEKVWHDRFRDCSRRAVELTAAPAFTGRWRADVFEVVRWGDVLPVKLTDPVPGSPAVAQPRGQVVAQGVPFEFARVYAARRDWQTDRDRLTDLRTVADLLAATDPPGPDDGEPSHTAYGLLTVSANAPNGLAADKLARLRTLGQAGPTPPAGWELTNFPDPGRSLLTARAQASLDAATRAVRDRLAVGLSDTPAGWKAVARTLDGPDLRPWADLLAVIARLTDRTAPGPVAEASAFLARPDFTLPLAELTLLLPWDVKEPRLSPAGPLTVTVTPIGGPPVVRSFGWQGGKDTSSRRTAHRFTPDGEARVIVRPGDGLTAEVPVRSGSAEFKLSWAAGGSNTFAFDRLTRPPVLVPVAPPGPPQDAGKTELVLPAGAVPAWPAVLPR